MSHNVRGNEHKNVKSATWTLIRGNRLWKTPCSCGLSSINHASDLQRKKNAHWERLLVLVPIELHVPHSTKWEVVNRDGASAVICPAEVFYSLPHCAKYWFSPAEVFYSLPHCLKYQFCPAEVFYSLPHCAKCWFSPTEVFYSLPHCRILEQSSWSILKLAMLCKIPILCSWSILKLTTLCKILTLSSWNIKKLATPLGDSGGVVNSLGFCRHPLRPLASFISGAYFLHNGRRWQWICKFYTANIKSIFGGSSS